MKQYLDLLQNILDNGIEKESGRANMPNTFGIEDGDIKMDLRKGFPLLTTKKMYWKGIIHELLWFLRGETNIKYLVNNNVNIWNGDAYRWYLKYCNDNKIEVYFDTQEKFVDFIKNIKSMYYDSMNILHYELETTNDKLYSHLLQLNVVNYIVGDLGKVYGFQWRSQNGVDQIKDLIEGLQKNPYSRYHIIDAWNAADIKDMALAPCHLLYQFIVRPLSTHERLEYLEFLNYGYNPGYELGRSNDYYISFCDNHDIPKFYLSLNMYQRSCDTFLGVPFNIASMSALLIIVAKTCNMIPRYSKWIGGDIHLYLDHIELAKEQIKKEPYELPKLFLKRELSDLNDILQLTIDDFELIGYKSHEAIKAELFTGLKKQ